jgi:hypothetical protein
MSSWLKGRTSPEMLYWETKWSSRIPFAKTADLLQEVWPVADSVNAPTVRHPLQEVGELSRSVSVRPTIPFRRDGLILQLGAVRESDWLIVRAGVATPVVVDVGVTVPCTKLSC